MGRRETRRVLILAVLVALAYLVVAAWFRRCGSEPTPEERAREQAERLRDKVRQLTR